MRPRLLEEITKLWAAELSIQAPALFFAEVKRSANTFHVHFLNYPKTVRAWRAIEIRGKACGRAVCTLRPAKTACRHRSPQKPPARTSALEVPAFREYALLRPIVYRIGKRRPAASTATPWA
jgi:hypothetical protein